MYMYSIRYGIINVHASTSSYRVPYSQKMAFGDGHLWEVAASAMNRVRKDVAVCVNKKS